MIDETLVAHLDRHGLRYCLIGATAMAVHGFARYTADVDLLTMDATALDPAFWSGMVLPEIHAADVEDPLGGVVRWSGETPHDLIIGRGYAMRFAVDTAVRSTVVPCAVATPLALLLLKLVAGGPQDEFDIIGFVDAQRALGKADWLSLVATHSAQLPREAQLRWERLAKTTGIA